MKDQTIRAIKKYVGLTTSEINMLLEVPPSPEFGDYAFPCFTLAKQYKKNPMEIAQSLAKKISSKHLEKVEAKGPYINFFINKKILAKQTITKILNERDKYGSQKINEKVLIESPAPNTNKPLHIGHARNMILAQSFREIFAFQGNNAKVVNEYNDRGIHICKSMVAYNKFGKGDSPEKQNKKPDHFVGDYYVKYAQEAKNNPNLEKEAQDCLKKWEAGDKKTISLWKKMNSWTYKGFDETYKKLGFKIDKEYYESKIYKKGRKIILEQLRKGNVNQKPDKAIYVDLSKQGLGEKILIRSDGTSIYITFDLHLALQRKKDFNFDKMFYVVANEQNYHFKVLFELLKIFGYIWADKLNHLSYGLVHLESGRMKSREGTVVDLDDLIEELTSLAKKEIEQRYPKITQEEKTMRANKIALAALRYYFLRVEKGKDMLFKPEESISFEGNTGPYLLYTYARARSILRKSNYKPKQTLKITALTDSEKNLITQLASFPEAADKAYKSLSPNLIANYAFKSAKTFNEFYHSNKVIGSKEEQFRLTLTDVFSQVLKNTLSLLHIETLEEM